MILSGIVVYHNHHHHFAQFSTYNLRAYDVVSSGSSSVVYLIRKRNTVRAVIRAALSNNQSSNYLNKRLKVRLVQ